MTNKRQAGHGGMHGPPDFSQPAIPDADTSLPRKALLSASYLNISYARQSAAQKLDLFLPAKGKKPYPVILQIHGGGWMIGDKRWDIAQFGAAFLPLGFAIAAMNHRPSNKALFPAQIYDAKAAVRWLRANAAQYSLDTNRIIAWGNSSGGHLAALLGTAGDVKELEGLSQGSPGQSSRVNFVVCVSIPVDFLNMDAQKEQLGLPETAFSPETDLIGGRVSQFPERARAANPMTYISQDSPPFYIQHAKDDDAVPYLQSVNLAKALAAVIGADKVKLELGEDSDPSLPPLSGHAVSPAELPHDMKAFLAFLNRHLKL